MPIYSYRCENCGHQQDVLQKMSDPLLVDCPSCGQPSYRKQVTAAGFQLKGSGWYVTDFRNPAAKEGTKGVSKEADAAGSKDTTTTDSSGPKVDNAPAPSPAKSDAAPAPAPASKPAQSGGSSGGGSAGGGSGGTS